MRRLKTLTLSQFVMTRVSNSVPVCHLSLCLMSNHSFVYLFLRMRDESAS